MKWMRLCLCALMLLAIPRPAHAQSDFWDFIESFSGPGPFKGRMTGGSVRLACLREQQGEHYAVGSCLSDVDRNIRALLIGDYSLAWTGDHPVFSDTPGDVRGVTIQKFGLTYMARISPLLDVGFGGGGIVFTGTGFTANWYPQVTPVAVTFVPFGYFRGSSGATRWGRFVRLKFSEVWEPKEILAQDFSSKSAYAKDGDFVRNFSVDFDLGVLIFGRKKT